MFRGITGITLDNKGRFAIPTRYREPLAEEADHQVVVTIDTEDRCLLLYPLPEWETIETKIEALPSFNPMARRIQRLLMGHACELEMDNTGRILLPVLLREYAGIEKQIILVGQGKKFEIWSDTAWQSHRDRWLSSDGKARDGLPPELETLSL